MEYLGIKLELSPIPVSNVHWLLFQNEFWKLIDEKKGCYMVSSLGRLKSKIEGRRRDGKWMLIKAYEKNKGKGYCEARLSYPNEKMIRPLLHRLVMLTFRPIANIEMFVNHKNMRPSDSRLCNLEWVSHRENLTHKKNTDNTKSSKYTGVTFEKSSQRWRARGSYAKKKICMGRYSTEEEASLAYKNKMTELGVINKYAITV